MNPELVLNVAERYRQTNSFAEALLTLTLRRFLSLHRKRPQIRLSLNRSPSKLGDPRLIEILDQWLDQLLASHGIPADLITIKLTRRSVLRPNPLVCANLAKRRAAGMAISLDDFGTRFPSLRLLHPWHPDAVPLPAAPLRLRALWSNSAPRCSGSAAISEDGFARFPQAPSMSHVSGTSPAAGPLGPGSDGGSDPGAPQPNPGDQPHNFSVQKEVHRQIRNDPDYDDWEYGTEPLPQEAWKLKDAAPADPA